MSFYILLSILTTINWTLCLINWWLFHLGIFLEFLLFLYLRPFYFSPHFASILMFVSMYKIGLLWLPVLMEGPSVLCDPIYKFLGQLHFKLISLHCSSKYSPGLGARALSFQPFYSHLGPPLSFLFICFISHK